MREAEPTFERIMRLLGESCLCARCGATLATFSVVCTPEVTKGGVGERCPVLRSLRRERIKQALDEEYP
jgi:hypothetical protein